MVELVKEMIILKGEVSSPIYTLIYWNFYCPGLDTYPFKRIIKDQLAESLV